MTNLILQDDWLVEGQQSGMHVSQFATNQAQCHIGFTDYYIYTGGSVTFEHKSVSKILNILPVDVCHDYADDFIYHRVWVTDEIDFGLITEMKSDEIVVWNSFFDRSVQISDFDDPGHSGISIDTVTIPTLLHLNGYETYTVTVSPAGPPTQDTTFDWTVYLTEFETNVVGTRLIPFLYDINWITGEKFSYEWHNSLYISKTTHEQRRGLSDDVFRRNSVYLTLENEIAYHFVNLMKYTKGKFFVVPIYNELILPSANPSGATVSTEDDLSYHWNLNNFCDYVLLVDHEENISEAKEISVVSTNSITFTTDVSYSFDKNVFVMYPTFVGIVESYNYLYLTDTKIRANVTFKEMRVNAQ